MGLENCKFSLKMPQRILYTLTKGQWLTLSKHLEHWWSSFLKRLKKASVFCIMADECTDITAVEELSGFFCHCEEDGTPVKCFLDNVPLKKADAASIYLALVKCIKDQYLQVGNIVRMGYDGAATFSGKKDLSSNKAKETCSTCSICPLSLPAISFRGSC